MLLVPLGEIPYAVRHPSMCYHFLPQFTEFQDHPTIVFNAKESVEMPFRTFDSQESVPYADSER